MRTDRGRCLGLMFGALTLLAAEPALAADGGPACSTTGDCFSPNPYCHPVLGYCVECLAELHCQSRSEGSLSCDTATGRCVECRSDVECGGSRPYCSPTSARCVECLTNANCGTAGIVCANGRCGSCGDGHCSRIENPWDCPRDCNQCGDGYCTEPETACTCQSDCSFDEYCGNGCCSPLDGPGCPDCIDGGGCGNGIVDSWEMCDGTDFRGETCATATLGSRPSGTLRCLSCSLDISGCIGTLPPSFGGSFGIGGMVGAGGSSGGTSGRASTSDASVSGASSGGTSGSLDGGSCIPGQAVLCIGAEECEGARTCRADGLGFGPCQCAGEKPDAAAAAEPQGDEDSGCGCRVAERRNEGESVWLLIGLLLGALTLRKGK